MSLIARFKITTLSNGESGNVEEQSFIGRLLKIMPIIPKPKRKSTQVWPKIDKDEKAENKI